MKRFKCDNLIYYSKEKLRDYFLKEVKKMFTDKDYIEESYIPRETGKGSVIRTIHKVNILKQNYYLKKFSYTNKRQCFRLNIKMMQDKAMRYYKNSELMDLIGINHVKADAVFIYTTGIFHYECILVTKDYCDGNNGQTYKDYIKGKKMPRTHIKKIVEDLFCMLDNNFFYNDFHLENILFIDQKIYYLDLDGGYQIRKKISMNRERTISLCKENLEREYKYGVISKNDYNLFMDEIRIKEKKFKNR